MHTRTRHKPTNALRTCPPPTNALHTCPPPTIALKKWLEVDAKVTGNYGHLLLEQKNKTDQNLLDALRPYFESAHLDAREYFHKQIGISLHPDAESGPLPVSYPNSLPSTTHRGLFGEVLAGLVTEAYQSEFVGGYQWRVPIFLFRQHEDVELYLWTLRFDPTRTRRIMGRRGSDFIGISVDARGEVARLIVGEAKWRTELTNSVVKTLLLGPHGIWFEINRAPPIPHGLRQLQRLLEQRDPEGHAGVILSIDRALLHPDSPPGQTNLVLLAGNAAKKRKPRSRLIPSEKAPAEYKAPHDLQVVEVILEGGDALIDQLYASLWQDA